MIFVDIALLVGLAVLVGLVLAYGIARLVEARITKKEEETKRSNENRRATLEEEVKKDKLIADWASGDTTLREQAVSLLVSSDVGLMTLAVLEDFVLDPSNFTCGTVQNRSSGSSYRYATALNATGVRKSLYFFSSSNQYISAPEFEKVTDTLPIHLYEGTIVLRIVRNNKDAAPGEIIATDRAGGALAVKALNCAFGRSVLSSGDKVPESQADEDIE